MDIICFHNPEEENGYLSNWYEAEFIVDHVKFSSMEQYMMYQKAIKRNKNSNFGRMCSERSNMGNRIINERFETVGYNAVERSKSTGLCTYGDQKKAIIGRTFGNLVHQ